MTAMKASILGLLLVAACGDGGGNAPDAPPGAPDGPPGDEGNPLNATGLCADPGCQAISANVREYEPQFALYDDAATKRRWIYLPPGTQIDTTDMDHWVFPVGTKLWKEFARDGVRVETRLLEKLLADDNAPRAWNYATYAWNAAQDDTELLTDGRENANGTQHDIPSRNDCRACHDRVIPTRVLGFGAIQLDIAKPAPLLDLDDLIAMGALTTAPAGTAIPHYPVPGNAVAVAALGYLHVNCSHCHNPTSDIADSTDIDLRLRVGSLGSVAQTQAYLSTVNVAADIPYPENGTTLTTVIVPGQPDMSAMIGRMNATNPIRFMPNLAVETVDPDGQVALRAWIQSL